MAASTLPDEQRIFPLAPKAQFFPYCGERHGSKFRILHATDERHLAQVFYQFCLSLADGIGACVGTDGVLVGRTLQVAAVIGTMHELPVRTEVDASHADVPRIAMSSVLDVALLFRLILHSESGGGKVPKPLMWSEAPLSPISSPMQAVICISTPSNKPRSKPL